MRTGVGATMDTLASTLAGGSGAGGDPGGGTGDTDRDRDPFDPNVASSPLIIHARPFSFMLLSFLASEIAPFTSSGRTEASGLGCTTGADEGPGAEVEADADAGFH